MKFETVILNLSWNKFSKVFTKVADITPNKTQYYKARDIIKSRAMARTLSKNGFVFKYVPVDFNHAPNEYKSL
jgi:hypothetical protein